MTEANNVIDIFTRRDFRLQREISDGEEFLLSCGCGNYHYRVISTKEVPEGRLQCTNCRSFVDSIGLHEKSILSVEENSEPTVSSASPS